MVDRRTTLAGLGAGIASLSGCLAGVANTASGCLSPAPPDARTPREVREALPRYDTPPASTDDRRSRADEIQEALWRALEGHPWRCSIGRRQLDGDPAIVVFVTCLPRARRYLPDPWAGIDIEAHQTACGEHELQ